MEQLLEQSFIDNLDKLTIDTKDLIMMVIKYDNFIVDFKLKVLKKLFSKISDVNFGDDEKTNPLMFLCENPKITEQKIKLIKFLVEEVEVNINKMSPTHKSAIIYAYQNCKMDIVEYLISQKALISFILPNGNAVNILDYTSWTSSRERITLILLNSYSNRIKEENVVTN